MTILSFSKHSLIIGFFLFISSANAQWSSDPNVNLAVCDTSGNQELPKIALTSDGGCYISWFDTRGGGYKVYMQRLNTQGIRQWETTGLLVSANPQNTSLVDYDLAVDDSNYAVVVFTDIRNGGQIEPFAYRISPQGSFMWGANGVALSTSSSTFQANPKVVCTSDGGYVFTWIFTSTPRKVALQKLNAAGSKQWGVDPILISGAGAELLDYPSIVRSDNGSVIMLMSGYTGSFLNPQNYHLYTQKYSSAGLPLWGASYDTVYALGRVSGFFVPKLIPDGNNGALYVWHDDRNNTGSSFSHVQHITSTDTKLFPANGSAGSTLGGRLHNDAWAAVAPATGETYMFWYETDAAFQSSFGVYGQKFSSNGTRQWPDSGKVLRPIGGGQPSFIRCFAKDSSAVAFFLDGVTVTTNLVRGFKVDRGGSLLWGGTIKDVSSVSSSKGRLSGVFTTNGTSLLTWADQRADGNGIYAQNVNYDGTLGNTQPTQGWTIQNSGTTATLNSVKAVSQDVAWGGGNSGIVVRTTNGGTTWESVGGGAIGSADVYTLDALDATTAFVSTTPNATNIYKTSNGGTSWTLVYTLAGGFIDGIQMVSSTVGYALGDPVPNPGGNWTLLKTTDGGNTWSPIIPALPQLGSEAGWNNSFQVLGNSMWFGTNAARIYHSTNLGSTWTSSTGPDGYSVWFNDMQTGMAGSFRTTDGGITWIPVTIPGTGSIDAIGGAGSHFFAAKGSTIYKSTDRGTTWGVSYGYSAFDINFTAVGTNLFGWAVGESSDIASYSGSLTDVNEEETQPQQFSLSQNYPNPFNPSTRIRFEVPSSGLTQLTVFDVLGRELAILLDEELTAGTHEVNFDASSFASGVYFYRLTSGSLAATRKLLLLK